MRHPLHPAVRDSEPLVARLLASYDPATGAVTGPEALPHCPNCGGEVGINVRVGPEFVDAPHLPAGRRLPHARLVRINPADLADRALPGPADAQHLLDALTVAQPAPEITVAPRASRRRTRQRPWRSAT
ncbi:hypothetical protein AB5J72_44475 [Streptomyces sp. CG1]|uniref:hypothetical protein n=1 Tax=Streptomyces sp. CG1 TaxID=1287523 RepID=UPI0034E1AD6E